jgi:hypothetical protein
VRQLLRRSIVLNSPEACACEERGRMQTKIFLLCVLCILSGLILAACSASLTPAPVALSEGRYTPLGANPKSEHPTPGDLADLQMAEQGNLQLPAFVEFYGDT